MADTLLAVKGVTAGYGNATVLRNVSLEVPKGALVSIIGPNGHGKTTLLRSISGMLRPTRGEITFNGQSLGDYRVDQIVAMGVAHIPQGDLIFSEMTVRDNLLMGAHLPYARGRVDRSLQEVFGIFPRLKERQAQIASTLSGGERRMLSIGRGMMLCGQIMLIDEPSLGLAPLAIDVIYKVIKALKDDGRTVLLVEENASRIIGLADHTYLLDHGEFVWQGQSSELEFNQEVLQTYLGG
jgi:branched-chain amino acid transport system ATP-binding protein